MANPAIMEDDESRRKNAKKSAVTGENPNQMKARRFAVKFQPPCIFLEYEDVQQKLRVREVKLSKVPPDTDPDRLTRKVIRSFPRQLDEASVKYDQVLKLVSKILDHMKNQLKRPDLQTSINKSEIPSAKESGPRQLQPLTKPTLDTNSCASNLSAPHLLPSFSPTLFEPTMISPSDHHNRMSLDSEDRFSSSSIGHDGHTGRVSHDGPNRNDHLETEGTKRDTPNFDLNSALNDLDREFGGNESSDLQPVTSPEGSTLSREPSYTSAGFASLGSVTSTTSVNQQPKAVTGAGNSSIVAQTKTRFSAEGSDRLVLDVEIEGDVDLNKVTEMELKLAKMKMDENFIKNQKRPGDPGYEYDKQVEFAPATDENEWDDSDSEDDCQEKVEGVKTAPPHCLNQAESDPESISRPSEDGSRSKGVGSDGDRSDGDYSYGDQLSDTAADTVDDEISPRRVAIDTDSSLELPDFS